jgi:hypothetical protein
MSANITQTGRSIGSIEVPWTAIFLIFVVTATLLITAGILTKDVSPSRGGPADVAASTGVPTAEAGPTARVPTLIATLRALLKELAKQALDQPGHFLIAAVPILLSRRLTGVPWYGWAVVPLLAYREWLQWPSNRWWDPPLDWAVLALGVVVATWAIRSHITAWSVTPAVRPVPRAD